MVNSFTRIQNLFSNSAFGSQPEDWNDEEDGEWIPPTIPNPEYKGPWKPKVDEMLVSCEEVEEFWKLTILLIVFEILAENEKPKLHGAVGGTYD